MLRRSALSRSLAACLAASMFISLSRSKFSKLNDDRSNSTLKRELASGLLPGSGVGISAGESSNSMSTDEELEGRARNLRAAIPTPVGMGDADRPLFPGPMPGPTPLPAAIPLGVPAFPAAAAAAAAAADAAAPSGLPLLRVLHTADEEDDDDPALPPLPPPVEVASSPFRCSTPSGLGGNEVDPPWPRRVRLPDDDARSSRTFSICSSFSSWVVLFLRLSERSSVVLDPPR